jgi:hypothetical protein
VTDAQKQTPAQKLIGAFTPKLISLTDDVSLRRHLGTAELSPRDRSLITVACLSPAATPNSYPGAWNGPSRTDSPRPNSKKPSSTWPYAG